MNFFDKQWYARHQNAIAQGCLTNSKAAEAHVFGAYPIMAARAHGPYLVDTDGKRYLDFICGLGANLFGYGHPHFINAVEEVAKMGASHSLPTIYEVLAAEKIKEVWPWAERVKFLKSGTDACNAAVRIARAYTGRKRVLSQGYHGWGDLYVSLAPPAAGVMDDFEVANLTDLNQIDAEVACVIVEPVIVDDSPERIAWLRLLQERCHKKGAVLIFDEIITGLRYPCMSVSEAHGLKPDIMLLSKALGFGMPLSAVVGRHKDMMDNKLYFVSTTTAGEVLSLNACIAALHQSQMEGGPGGVCASGKEFARLFNNMFDGLIELKGYGSRGTFVGDATTRAIFCQEMVKQGVLFHNATFFTNYPLREFHEEVLRRALRVRDLMADGKVALEGNLPTSPFAQKVREKS